MNPPPPQCCYLIMTHQDPAQIARLVRTILGSSAAGWILLVHDARACSLRGLPWVNDPRIVLQEHAGLRRGDYSAVQAYLDAVALALAHPWDWLVQLTGQDYPVRPLPQLEALLAGCDYDIFLRHWEIGGPADPWRPQQGRMRYHYRYRRLPDWTRPLLRLFKWSHALQGYARVFTTYGAHLGTRARTLPFGAGLRLYGGYVPHYLRRHCAEYLLDFCRSHPALIEHYRGTLAPDESVLPTVFANSGYRVCNAHRRYMEWEPRARGGHPRVLTRQDLAALRAADVDFARKFDPQVDSQILDLLDRLCGVSQA
jgi:hypothetical protein